MNEHMELKRIRIVKIHDADSKELALYVSICFIATILFSFAFNNIPADSRPLFVFSSIIGVIGVFLTYVFTFKTIYIWFARRNEKWIEKLR